MEKECYIIGGGPSLKGFDFEFLRDKNTIAVNKSILDVPNPNYFVTLDYLFLKKIDLDKVRTITTSKVFVACLHFDYMKEEDGRIIDMRKDLIYDLSDFDVIIKSRRVDDLGYSFGDFRNGLNSGYCGLQLAIILGYKRINLLGIDLQCMKDDNNKMNTHYHNVYMKNLKAFNKLLEIYYSYFVCGLHRLKKETDIKVISMSSISRLNDMIEYKEFGSE